ncbi:MAG: ATP-dependent DNA helicase RecG [Cytophagales bacterium]|nr:ATP-dependent DNA helicase RecG [Cytophagales bacterium]
MDRFFDTRIEFLKGVGPAKAELLNKELEIFSFGDLIQYYPFRYEDRTKFHKIGEVNHSNAFVQLKGKISHLEMVGAGRKKRLVAYLSDDTGEMELVWFKGAQWMLNKIKVGIGYIVFGKPSFFNGRFNIPHPEIDLLTSANEATSFFQAVYPSTEKLRSRFLDSKGISRLVRNLFSISHRHIRESLSERICNHYRLATKQDALFHVHFPKDQNTLRRAQYRLKFEEFFYLQLRLIKLKLTRVEKFKGQVFNSTKILTEFYNHHLPFELTNAQKKVIKEIYGDLKSGKQMNRLIQGDVGSGKTIVSFLCMLVVIGNGAQTALMAPTEILADQHYNGLKPFADELGLEMAILKGSSKKSERKHIAEKLSDGALQILIGTHALIEDAVQFKNLGLAIVDEQHRFGVAQRAKLWQKNQSVFPHILVMTATPIPRTLAMTLYGDLDVSIIDELPAGRKEILTMHKYDSNRLETFGFLRKQMAQGRQVYIVYPLIEESEKLDLKHLTDGYEAVQRAFPEYRAGILHGKMKAEAKDWEMQRFLKNETQIMVATTVIEVGVNVPNATVMVVENAERFGLAQLHQLRGRVGRGADQSYCILITGYKLTRESRKRINTMVSTTNGFEIAEADLKLRGPGDLLGTQQSGILDLLIADLGKDSQILEIARQAAEEVLTDDPNLEKAENAPIRQQVKSQRKSSLNWSRIS